MTTNLENLSDSDFLKTWQLARFQKSLYDLVLNCKREYAIRREKAMKEAIAALQTIGFYVVEETPEKVRLARHIEGAIFPMKIAVVPFLSTKNIGVKLFNSSFNMYSKVNSMNIVGEKGVIALGSFKVVAVGLIFKHAFQALVKVGFNGSQVEGGSV